MSLDTRVGHMARNLGKRYKRLSDFGVGLIALLCAEKLIIRHYRKNIKCAALVEYSEPILRNLSEFKKDLIGYTEIVKKNTET